MPSLSCKVEKTLGDMILIMISANQFDDITNIVQITFFLPNNLEQDDNRLRYAWCSHETPNSYEYS